ncbi:MAG: serine protein kinase RIO [Candidatus Micrarchaeales archaeon]
MARRVSKRKRPSREEYVLKEQLKIEEGVFDNRTMLSLGKLFTHNVISRMHFLIARGKESDVYLAAPGSAIKDELVVVKIFRIETSSFDRRLDYIIGDPRFEKIKRGMYHIVNAWCKKEFGNLKLAEMAKVNAPKPYASFGNVLAMEFIGENGVPAKNLKETSLENPKKVFEEIIKNIKKLYNVDLVHADLSEYNILMKNEKPYIIDFGQAVVASHPKAMEFLKRDISNISMYFSKKYGIDADPESIFLSITEKQHWK